MMRTDGSSAQPAAPRLLLAQALVAYLPEQLVADLLQDGAAGPQLLGDEQRVEVLDAVALMVDITGFTPLCEALAQQGREGAEQVTTLTNSFFLHALSYVQQWGGSIAKFAGDAFSAVFARRADEPWAATLQRACVSALDLQAFIQDYQGLQITARSGDASTIFRLSAKVGMGAGRVLAFCVGSPGVRRDWLVTGEPLTQATEAEHHAGAGDVVLHQSCLDHAGPLLAGMRLGEARDGCVPLLDLDRRPPHTLPPLLELDRLPETALEALIALSTGFLTRPLVERLKLGYQGLPGEHRRVVSLFVQFSGFAWMEDPDAPARFQQYYLAVLEQVERYGGYLSRISSGDKGDLLHILFGAPKSQQDDDEQAVRCALELQAVARGFPEIRNQKIGLSSGFVFAGETGSPTRHEYTVMGDSVNLSARLMQVAPNWSVVVDAATETRLGERFELSPMRAVELKGKRGSTAIATVLGVRAGRAAPAQGPGLQLYGRDAELAAALEQLRRARTGSGRSLAVSGEPGIGKSTFLAGVVHEWEALGGQACQVSLLHYERGAFTLWARWLAALFGLDPAAPAAARAATLHQAIAELDPALAEWAPLWGELLNLELEETPLLRALDRATRRQRLAQLTPQLLLARARLRPLLLLGDDLHWADSASLELLAQVVPRLNSAPLMVCLGYRPGELPAFPLLDDPYCLAIPLRALPAGASAAMVDQALDGIDLRPEERARLLALVNEQAGGNPLFIGELLSSLKAGDLLGASGARAAAPLSYNLQTLIMARLDALDARLRELMLVASVVGGHVTEELLLPILPPGVARELRSGAGAPLTELEQLDLLRREAPAGAEAQRRPSYRFRHALIQQVAYESLPYARRRALHEQVGDYIEARLSPSHAEGWLEQLAYHFERSANAPKAVRYLAQSAERSARLFANQEALAAYQAALERARRHAGPTEPGQAELLGALGDVQAQTADFPAALESYALAEEQWPPAAWLERARLEQRRCDVLVRATRFDEALDAIARAEQVLAQAPPGAPRPLRGEASVVRAELAELHSTILVRQGKYEQSIQAARHGLNLVSGLATRTPHANHARIKLYQALAGAAAMLNQKQRARQAVGEALRLARKEEDPVTEGQLQLRLAILAMQQEQLARACVLFEQTLPKIEKTGARDRTAYVLLPGGQTLLFRGDYVRAKTWLERGLQLAEEVGTPFLICSGYHLLSLLEETVGNWDRALELREQGVTLAEEHQLWNRYAEYLSHKGKLLGYRGSYKAAEQLLEQALQCSVEHDLPINISIAQQILTELHCHHGQFARSQSYLLEAWRQLPEPAELSTIDAFTILRIAEWWALRTFDGQTPHSPISASDIAYQADCALTLLQLRDFKMDLPTARRINGLLCWSQGRTQEAASHFHAGLRIARKTRHVPETGRLLLCSALLQSQQPGEHSPAGWRKQRAALNEAAALFQKLGAQPELRQAKQQLGRLYQLLAELGQKQPAEK